MKATNHKLFAMAALAATATGVTLADDTTSRLFMDMHDLDSVTAEAVADAHEKDLAVQDAYDVNFVRYWVDEENGKVFCLAEADDAESVSAAHAEAHGLIPQYVSEVTQGE